jgi:chromosome transmission fidelity protein 1
MQLDLSAPSKFEAFPYAKPYDIQDDLMRHLYSAIEARGVTIIESPTGTASSLLYSTFLIKLMQHMW